MDKSRQIISELQSFFKNYDVRKAINGIMTVMDSLTIQSRTVGPVKNPNCKLTFVQAVKLLILFPFFSVKNAAGYADSGLGKLFSCGKDMFYRPMDDGRIDWRHLISTDTGIDAKEAFRLYSRRWVIEVAHKEMKGLLNLGKCQCIDFAGQIAGLSLCMIKESRIPHPIQLGLIVSVLHPDVPCQPILFADLLRNQRRIYENGHFYPKQQARQGPAG